MKIQGVPVVSDWNYENGVGKIARITFFWDLIAIFYKSIVDEGLNVYYKPVSPLHVCSSRSFFIWNDSKSNWKTVRFNGLIVNENSDSGNLLFPVPVTQ